MTPPLGGGPGLFLGRFSGELSPELSFGFSDREASRRTKARAIPARVKKKITGRKVLRGRIAIGEKVVNGAVRNA
jgi:hypothetical protein